MDSQLSRSEKKRRAKSIEHLVIELAALTKTELQNLPCDDEIRGEIVTAQTLKGGARRRQLKYVTKLLREKPVEELYEFLAEKKGSSLKKNQQFHELEHLRNLLINEAVQSYEDCKYQDGYLNENEPEKFLDNSKTIGMIRAHLPLVDRTSLKNTAMQFARTRNRKFSRELFRIMKAALEKGQFVQK
jgi:ribosome-associated protein